MSNRSAREQAAWNSWAATTTGSAEERTTGAELSAAIRESRAARGDFRPASEVSELAARTHAAFRSGSMGASGASSGNYGGNANEG
jgi:hypothetical protein